MYAMRITIWIGPRSLDATRFEYFVREPEVSVDWKWEHHRGPPRSSLLAATQRVEPRSAVFDVHLPL